MISPHAVDWRSTDFQPGDIVVLGETLLQCASLEKSCLQQLLLPLQCQNHHDKAAASVVMQLYGSSHVCNKSLRHLQDYAAMT